MRNLAISTTLVLVLVLAACGGGGNPADCEKGNDEVCQSLCETGKEEFRNLCFMPRARKALACAEKGTDCEAACKEWPLPGGLDEDRRNIFMGNIGDTAKVAAIDARCAQAAGPAAAPTTP